MTDTDKKRPSDHEIGGPALRAGAILRRVGAKTSGAEVGVFRGALSRKLLEGGVAKLFMVDNWLPTDAQPEHYKATGDWHSTRTASEVADDERKARAAVGAAGGRAVVLKMSSVEAASKIDDGSLDFVFLDADHSYEGLKADIAAWLPKVKRGGWLGGHDYENDHPDYDFSGVKRAVDEALPAGVELDVNYTWFWHVG